MTTNAQKQLTEPEIRTRLAQIERYLAPDPGTAANLATEILQSVPEHPLARLFLGIARRLQGNPVAAMDVLAPLCDQWPDAPLPHLQLGLACREAKRPEQAEPAMRRAVVAKPDFPDAWLALGDLLRSMDRHDEAGEAYLSYVQCSGQDADIAAASVALRDERAGDAERILRARLERHPTDVAAMCLLAEAFSKSGFFDEAEIMLRDCLALAPGYRAARQNYAVLLMWQNRLEQSLEQANILVLQNAEDDGPVVVKANVLRRMGEYETCADLYRKALDRNPHQPDVWSSLGHTLRTLGDVDGCVAAYRKALELAPETGQAWWSLANLKPSPLTEQDVTAMESRVDSPDLPVEERVHLHFALGRALEGRGEYERSFRHYESGNRMNHARSGYDPGELTEIVQRSKDLLTREFFAGRSGYGCTDGDPIFVVGLPRSGSTLVEQILSSHSDVEGTTELPDIPALVKKLDGRKGNAPLGRYPLMLAQLTAQECAGHGMHYLSQTRLQRKRAASRFIDKMPNNFIHIGLIHLILPNARVIDVRRHPLACGYSLFKLLFGHGQNFAYDLGDIARYYRDYVALMAHYDTVLPGRVHRVIYENLVDDTEQEVRRMLAYCGLPFEENCLRFYESRRPVSTPSAEQVRSPIFREGIDQWRHFEPWLDPLKEGLGEVLETWSTPSRA